MTPRKAHKILRPLLALTLTTFSVFAASNQRNAPPESLTALDRYVHAPDPAYAWKPVRTIPAEGTTAHVLSLTSQQWLTTNEVDHPVWHHWLTVIIPDQVVHDTALLFISGGSNKKPAPEEANAELSRIAKVTRSIVAELRMVPNQPLVFTGDGRERSEDELIAYTWDRFLRTGEDRWPARLPMTKSAVRAMDTVTAFGNTAGGGHHAVRHYVVAGASKRGWTTWTTAAVDQRVVALMPIVIDMLNIEPSFIHHWEAYGFYAPAVQDYEDMHIMEWQGTPEYRRLMELVEPYEYLDRLTQPKFIINATGDQFFLPDSSQFYFDALPGVKYLRYIPNADHSLRDTDAYETLLACYGAVLDKTPLPRLKWVSDAPGHLHVTTRSRPTEVLLWQATNPGARDFRVETIGKPWTSHIVLPQAPGEYVAEVKAPPKGWTAFLMELNFPNPGGSVPFKFTTAVQVVPDTKLHNYQSPARPPR